MSLSPVRTPDSTAIVAFCRDVSARREVERLKGEEVSAVVGFVRGAFWILSQRGRSLGVRPPSG